MHRKIFILFIFIFTNAMFGAAASPKINLPAPIAELPKPTPEPVVILQKTRNIKIKADIKPDELGYKKFFSTYYPDTLKIRANGKEVYSLTKKDVVEAKEITIPVDGDKVVIEYDYEWDMITGKRTGTKQAQFKVNDKIDKLELEFGSWKNDNRIVIPQAKQVGEEKKLK